MLLGREREQYLLALSCTYSAIGVIAVISVGVKSAVSMQRNVEYRRVIVECFLSSIAMMNIPEEVLV